MTKRNGTALGQLPAVRQFRQAIRSGGPMPVAEAPYGLENFLEF